MGTVIIFRFETILNHLAQCNSRLWTVNPLKTFLLHIYYISCYYGSLFRFCLQKALPDTLHPTTSNPKLSSNPFRFEYYSSKVLTSLIFDWQLEHSLLCFDNAHFIPSRSQFQLHYLSSFYHFWTLAVLLFILVPSYFEQSILHVRSHFYQFSSYRDHIYISSIVFWKFVNFE